MWLYHFITHSPPRAVAAKFPSCLVMYVVIDILTRWFLEIELRVRQKVLGHRKKKGTSIHLNIHAMSK